MTHDVMAALVESLGAQVDAVEITELRDGAYIALVALSGPTGEQRLDSRPSDAIALAVRLGAPVYVNDDVLDLAGTLPEAPTDDTIDGAAIDDDAIDDEIEKFRAALEHLEPADFVDPPAPEAEGPASGEHE